MKINPRNADNTELYWRLMNAIVPRPVALISTVGENGVFNLAPFSCFGTMGMRPSLIYTNISRRRRGQKKDTLINIEFTKDFVVNIVNEDLAEAVNQSSVEYPSSIDEFKEVGLTPVKADTVTSPMVAESPISMECQLVEIIELGGLPRHTSVVIGEVVQVHIKDRYYVNGEIQISALRVLGRLEEDLYCLTTDIIKVERPPIP